MAIQIAAPAVYALARAVLRALGFGAVAFVGVDTILNTAEIHIKSSLSGLPGEVAGLLGLFGIDTAISLILSAYTVRVAMWSASKLVRL